MQDRFYYNKYSPKEMWKKFGVYSVHFFPFENQDLDAYNPKMGLSIEEYSEKLKEYQYSTVYQGIRYFFKEPHKLQEFCEMIEREVDNDN